MNKISQLQVLKTFPSCSLIHSSQASSSWTLNMASFALCSGAEAVLPILAASCWLIILVMLLLPGSGNSFTAGLCKQQGCFGELAVEAYGDCRVWHLEHQDDEMENKDTRTEQVLFSERKYLTHHELGCNSSTPTPNIQPEIHHGTNDSMTGNRAIVLCKEDFLRNRLLATAGGRIQVTWSDPVQPYLLWFAINNTVSLKSHFLQSYQMRPPTTGHPPGTKQWQS